MVECATSISAGLENLASVNTSANRRSRGHLGHLDGVIEVVGYVRLAGQPSKKGVKAGTLLISKVLLRKSAEPCRKESFWER